jgi:hypothetical protein
MNREELFTSDVIVTFDLHNTTQNLPLSIANSTADNEQFKLKSTVSIKCCRYPRCTSTLY